MTLATGAVLGHYEIIGLISSGGTGAVYRACDTRLGQIVALKLVDDLSCYDVEPANPPCEARAIRPPNHPNICTVYDVGEADGRTFIVMEYAEGRPLSQVALHDGLLPSRVIGIGIQIASALAHADRYFILHRDLTPQHVLLAPDGHATVLNFRFPRRKWDKDVACAPTAPLGSSVTIAGTIAYMAPEVLQGKAAGPTKDIWALGAILFELATGSRPFTGRTDAELVSQILRDPPPPLPASVPDALARVIRHCLAKDPGERYQHAADVGAALEACQTAIPTPVLGQMRRLRRMATVAALATAAVLAAYASFHAARTPAVRAIAVVPFTNAGGNRETEYLSDGITESLINSLSQLPPPALRVIALNSVRQYRGREIDPQSVGRDLAVQAIVIGRVVQRAERLSVSAELVNVRDRSRIWGATYDTALADVLATQDDIATRISDGLRVRLDGQAKKKLTKRYTENVAAYNLYLKGRYALSSYAEEGETRAIDYFRQALDIDPAYALAWAGIADAYYQLSSIVAVPADVMPRARAAAIKALEIDEALAEAHASLAVIKLQYDWDRPGAAREFRRAIELNPNYATAHQWFGVYLYSDARFEEALAEFLRAQELDPLAVRVGVTAIWPLPHLGRRDEALRQLDKVIAMHPTIPDLEWYSHELRGDGYFEKKMYDEAAAEYVLGSTTQLLTGGSPEAMAALTSAYRASGFKGYWERQLALAAVHHHDAVEQARRQQPARYVSPYRLAELHARLGDTDRAFALLEQCYDSRDENLAWLKVEALTAGSGWQHLSSDRRFADLLRRLGLGG